MPLLPGDHYLQDATLASLSPAIGHGFFTRKGGVSTGLYGSLNCGAGSDDIAEKVVENKRRVAEAMSVLPQNLLTLYQIHSDTVLTVDAPFAGERPQADGMVTKVPGLALGILTADCGPVLLADAEAGIIGACHAGWKGAFADIAIRTVEAMEKLGASRARMSVAIGPSIQQKSYEVDGGFRTRFLEKDERFEVFFHESSRREAHFQFDLPGFIAARLIEAEVGAVNLLANDTCFEENAFFSFRRKTLRGEADYGRQVSVISLLP